MSGKLARFFAWASLHPLVVALTTVAMLGALWWTSCRPQPTPIPRAEQRSIDSLAATAPTYAATRDTLILRETVTVRQSTALARQAAATAHAADSLRDVANAAQRVAEASADTSSRWRAVALVRGQEADSLRVSNTSLTAALADQTIARTAADDRATGAEARLAAVTSLNTRLAHDVATAGQCRILPFVRCPTRKEAAIVGLVAGAVGATVSHSRSSR